MIFLACMRQAPEKTFANLVGFKFIYLFTPSHREKSSEFLLLQEYIQINKRFAQTVGPKLIEQNTLIGFYCAGIYPEPCVFKRPVLLLLLLYVIIAVVMSRVRAALPLQSLRVNFANNRLLSAGKKQTQTLKKMAI